MTDSGERTHVSAGMWDRLAAAWDAHGDWHAQVATGLTEAMVDALAPTPGQRIVEAACGTTADLARAVVARCPQCRVTATDLSPDMLAAARRRGGEALTYEILDVTNPDLPDGALDGLVARFVYMLLPDPAAALAQARRIIAPGGRLVFAVFDQPSTNPFFTVPASVVTAHGHLDPPRPGDPSLFALADPTHTTALLTAAGFTDVSHQAVDLAYPFPDLDALWAFISEFTGPIAMALSQVDPAEAAVIRTEIEARVPAFAQGSGYVMPGRALVFTAS